MRRAGAVLAVALAVSAAACLPRPKPQPESRLYDFGLPFEPAGHGPAIAASLVVRPPEAPLWLDSPAIQYRLAYEDPARIRSYAFSRWVSSPVRLFGDLLRRRLAEASTVAPAAEDEAVSTRYVLYTQVDEFSQVFDSESRSRAVVRARVALVRDAGRQVLAQTTFAVDRPAPSPDAPGAVEALAEASRELADRVVAWVAETLERVVPKPEPGAPAAQPGEPESAPPAPAEAPKPTPVRPTPRR